MAANEEAVIAGSTLEKDRSEALRLSEAERAELARSLVESLDGPADPDAESVWDAEIVRRLAEIDAGTAKLIDREEMRRRMRAHMNRSARRRGRRRGRGVATC